MFLTGLKFALGLIVGSFLFSGMFALAIGGAELFAYWLKKRRRPHGKAKAHAYRYVMPRFRERAVYQFVYRTDDWIQTPNKTEFRNESL